MHSVKVTEFAHRLIARRLQAGDVAVDATAGNGHDTLLLAGIVGDTGEVFAFDVQACALAATATSLRDKSLDRKVHLHQRGHEDLAEVVPGCYHGRVSAVMFNLGYLPGGDKSLITREQTTLSALQQALDILKEGGLCTIVCYPGHEGGAQEAQAVSRFIGGLDHALFRVERHDSEYRVNHPPFLLAVEKVSPGSFTARVAK